MSRIKNITKLFKQRFRKISRCIRSTRGTRRNRIQKSRNNGEPDIYGVKGSFRKWKKKFWKTRSIIFGKGMCT